jgi:hypothetical protein
MILISPLVGSNVFAVLSLAFLAFNSDFFLFLYKEKGFLFTVESVIVTWADMLVMGVGIAVGFIAHSFIGVK